MMPTGRMPGTLFFVVGPSGAGKDALMSGARRELGDSRYVFARRVITRPPDAPGEDHCAETIEGFERRRQTGQFLVTWEAHGLSYGLEANLLDSLRQGRHVVANGSRTVIADLARVIQGLLVVEICADPDTLAQRIARRGRESSDQLRERMGRRPPSLPTSVLHRRVNNNGELAAGIAAFLDVLRHPLQWGTAKRLKIDTGSNNVAYRCPPDQPGTVLLPGNLCLEQIRIDVVDEPGILAPSELGMPDQLMERLGIAAGSRLCWMPPPPPTAAVRFRRKLRGEPLGEQDYASIFRDALDGSYSELELVAFLAAATRGLSNQEVLDLARARAGFAQPMAWEEPIVVDLHSIGGVPGNRITLLVVPIVAAHGLAMPKASSRAITSPAGTADTMSLLAKVDLEPADVRRCIQQARACIAWNGRLHHSVVDDVMNRITRPLGLDSARWAVASILSKKFAMGITHLLVDLPFGPGAKLPTEHDAQGMADLFESVGRGLGITVKTVLCNGSAPIGQGIGPALEVRDVQRILMRAPDAPEDLREKALQFAAHILAWDPAIGSVMEGRRRARELLETGAAQTALGRIIAAQGTVTRSLEPGRYTKEIVAPQQGVVRNILGPTISQLARLAGAPVDTGAGIDLLCRSGQSVTCGQILYRIHSNDPGRVEQAGQWGLSNMGILIESLVVPHKHMA